MKSASRLFYLSVFALWTAPAQCAEDECAFSPKAIVNDACASYSTLDKLNAAVKPAIDDLTRTTDYFSHYRLNLFHKKCPFWNDENGMCGNIACAVETLDNEEDIPAVWRASELGKLEGPTAKHPGRTPDDHQRPLRGGLGENVDENCVFEVDDECDERDYCVPEDESASSKGDYVSLTKNPERFTGYAGFGAAQVWDAIYRENCFQRSSFPNAPPQAQSAQSSRPGGLSSGPGSGLGLGAAGVAAEDFKQIMEAAGRQQALQEVRAAVPNAPFVASTGFEGQDECLEKRVFYRVISGMHASISTHLCWDFLNQTTGEWQPNVNCYISRLHNYPDRISNLYFNYALVTRAVAKLGPHIQRGDRFTFCTGDTSEDAATRAKVLAVTRAASSVPDIFDESLMFKNGEGPSLKEDFRNRFRNVSRVMDCVGCDKCRLWGKVQTAGYGTALKVLFESDNDNEIPPLKRTELVALYNTYARISSSINAVGRFRNMVSASQPSSSTEATTATDADSATSEPLEPAASSSPASESDSDKPRKPHTLRDEFDEELGRFVRVVKLIITRWVSMPSTIYGIITSELKRLFQAWVGLPVNPRNWKFERPNLDEL
ncbi:endoplasmic reticulum Oxidoreductin 1 [Plectosphaerella plurivora]|uniref:Endoplasmic reticulum Oxidoreductin 1 n=1 Tax=Plectosphaerella plurivora TaxID=936078 RepID=A0A9P9ADL4_9PEZI|nr:endoplasmic reticulum Oxidoreductin 1 [Plectosphaerella plurivora]